MACSPLHAIVSPCTCINPKQKTKNSDHAAKHLKPATCQRRQQCATRRHETLIAPRLANWIGARNSRSAGASISQEQQACRIERGETRQRVSTYWGQCAHNAFMILALIKASWNTLASKRQGPLAQTFPLGTRQCCWCPPGPSPQTLAQHTQQQLGALKNYC